MPYDTKVPSMSEIFGKKSAPAASKGGIPPAELKANSQAAKKVTEMLIRHCSGCNRPSSKARLFQIREGLLCLSCMGGGMSVAKAEQLEKDYAAYLEIEANKPPPEGYGDFS